MFTSIIIVAILSIQLVPVYSGTVTKCVEDELHKKFPSVERTDLAACLPWQGKPTCCTAETTMDLKKNGAKNMSHFDWDYCGTVSEPCRKYLLSEACFYYCDPNVPKWSGLMGEIPICSGYCHKWFEACKNDKTYSDNWQEDFALYRNKKGPIKPNRPCRTFGEIFKTAKGLCNKIFKQVYKYGKSSNCVVFDFEGENPNSKVIVTSSHGDVSKTNRPFWRCF